MDVYLSLGAQHGLAALDLDPAPHCRDGILLGHQRGSRFYIESVFPFNEGFFSSPDTYFRLADHFENRIMGFYSFDPDADKVRRMLTPHVCGKVFLEIRPDEKGGSRLESFLVDFAGTFRLKKIGLRKERPGK